MMRRRAVMVGVVLAALMWATPAAAQDRRQFGVRGGVSADPDQFFVGGHYETRPIVDRLTFKPNIELGFDDDSILAALNFEFAYRIPIERKPFSLYVGGGPAVNIYNFTGGNGEGNEDNVGPGFNFLLGMQLNQGLFFELKLGVVDSPDFKFTVGYSFR